MNRELNKKIEWNELSIYGRGYKDFRECRKAYRVVKGSRSSKKSKSTALNFIQRLIQYPQSNLLVVRKTYRTLKDSCFAELKWAIQRLGVDKYFFIKESPLEIRYKPTGQKIIFRGLDDPMKITSITVEHGVLCWLWVEEAYEISNERDFDVLDESIRGEMPKGLFKQITLTLNPWNERHWIKARFFDAESDDVFALTTNYLINEWLSADDIKLFENMKINNPRRYAVAGLGKWGIVEGLIYENWREEAFNDAEIAKKQGIKAGFGLDFGYTTDPAALFCGLFDKDGGKIYVFDEVYECRLTNRALFEKIAAKGYSKERIIADSAEPKSIDELRMMGMSRVSGARKGQDSVAHGIQFIQNYEIIIHPRCVNFLREIGCYAWETDKTGRMLSVPQKDNNHLMDAMRYALETEMKAKVAFKF